MLLRLKNHINLSCSPLYFFVTAPASGDPVHWIKHAVFLNQSPVNSKRIITARARGPIPTRSLAWRQIQIKCWLCSEENLDCVKWHMNSWWLPFPPVPRQQEYFCQKEWSESRAIFSWVKFIC